MFAFFGNYLEPFAYAIYLIAVLIYGLLNKLRNKKVLFFYYAIATLLMLFASLLVKWKINNIWVYNAGAAFALFFIGGYFYYLFQNPIKKNALIFLFTFYTIYALIKNILFKEWGEFDSVGYAFVSASIVAFVFMYFHQVLKNVSEQNILHQFNFWLSSGYLVYFLGSFIIFVSYYYLTNKILDTYTKAERFIMTALWGVHNVLLFLCASSLLIGSLWLTYRRKSD